MHNENKMVNFQGEIVQNNCSARLFANDWTENGAVEQMCTKIYSSIVTIFTMLPQNLNSNESFWKLISYIFWYFLLFY